VIDFFELDTREGLLMERCWMLLILWTYLENRSSTHSGTKSEAEAFLAIFQDQHDQPHTACGRAFIELHERNHALAAACHDAATRYVMSKEAAVFTNLGVGGPGLAQEP
jgi:hypothetical protein